MVELRRRMTRRRVAGQLPRDQLWAAEVADALASHDDPSRPMTVTDVASALGVDQSQASRRVASAVSLGVVERCASQEDGRVSLLRLTRSGSGVLADIQQRRRAVVGQALAGWTAAEQSTFAELLARFTRELDDTKGRPAR